MEKVDILKLKSLSRKLLPSALKHCTRNGVECFPKTEDAESLLSSFLEQYRRWFYQIPRGREAFTWDVEEATLIEPETIEKAESFHHQRCLWCYKTADLKLTDDGWNYFFQCKNNSCAGLQNEIRSV